MEPMGPRLILLAAAFGVGRGVLGIVVLDESPKDALLTTAVGIVMVLAVAWVVRRSTRRGRDAHVAEGAAGRKNWD
ncbi:MAG: hypothetical protein M3345_00530 [Actinomycetota bacterium]|nr:hypothetical protein [Actinomycetota bacterium]